jgi:phospholipid/cholesterol/gamma-HCH transport system ATP-binding protein
MLAISKRITPLLHHSSDGSTIKMAAMLGKRNGARAHITVQNLTMAYGSFVLMRDLNLTISHGDVFIIMRGSGCGKSTLLRHLIGLKRAGAGKNLRRQGEFY